MTVTSHFLDSGSFSLQAKAAKYHTENTRRGSTKWDYYFTDEFWEFMESYTQLVKENEHALDHYANVDVIGNPELTLRNQKWLEKKGLRPVPVVHLGSGTKYLDLYVRAGYDYICLGGLVGKLNNSNSTGVKTTWMWVDECFEFVCDDDRIPTVKLHGFGITSYQAMVRWPWYSVDSSSWTKVGAYGNILVPHLRREGFAFGEPPYVLPVSESSSAVNQTDGAHISVRPQKEKDALAAWLKEIGLTYDAVESEYRARHIANLIYFERLRAWLPEWPWAFTPKGRRRGILDG